MTFRIFADGVLLAEEKTFSGAIETALAGHDLDPPPRRIVVEHGDDVLEIIRTEWIGGRQPWLVE